MPSLALKVADAPQSVALLHGCLHDALDANVNQSFINLCHHHRIKVHSIRKQCCGAMEAHLSQSEPNTDWNRLLEPYQNQSGFLGLVSSASACQLHMKNHKLPVCDPIALIQSFKLKTKTAKTIRLHLPCTLNNGLKQGEDLIGLLSEVGYQVKVDSASDYCCGSAGTYSLLQPKIAKQLGIRKANSLTESQVDEIVSANVGCVAHINSHIKNQPVIHWLELLARDCLQ